MCSCPPKCGWIHAYMSRCHLGTDSIMIHTYMHCICTCCSWYIPNTCSAYPLVLDMHKYMNLHIITLSACIHLIECIFWKNIHTWYMHDTYRYIQIHTIHTNMNCNILPVSVLYFCMYLVCIKCIFVRIACICMYLLQSKVLVASIHTIHTDTYIYAQDTYQYAQDKTQIHTKYMQIHTLHPTVSCNAYLIFGCFIVYVSVCMCIFCAYLVHILRGVHICL